MENEKTITAEELIDMQERVVSAATAELAAEQKTKPILFIVTAGGAVTEETKTVLREAGMDAMETAGASNSPDASTIVGFSMSTHPDNLYAQLLLTPGPLGLAAKAAHEFATSLNAPDPVATTVRQLMKVTGLTEQDIQAEFIRGVLHLLSAIAFLKVDEVYLGKRKDIAELQNGPRPRDDPKSREAILVQLETAGWSRLVAVPFVRRQRETGAVLLIAPAEVLSDTRNGQTQQEGRFIGLLRPTSKMPSA